MAKFLAGIFFGEPEAASAGGDAGAASAVGGAGPVAAAFEAAGAQAAGQAARPGPDGAAAVRAADVVARVALEAEAREAAADEQQAGFCPSGNFAIRCDPVKNHPKSGVLVLISWVNQGILLRF